MNLCVGVGLITSLTSFTNRISVTSEGLRNGFEEMSNQHAKFSNRQVRG
jgi:hypothetical protein